MTDYNLGLMQPDKITNSIKNGWLTIDDFCSEASKDNSLSLTNILGFVSIYRYNLDKYLYNGKHILTKLRRNEYLYIHQYFEGKSYKIDTSKSDTKEIIIGYIQKDVEEIIDVMVESKSKNYRYFIKYSNLIFLSHNFQYDLLTPSTSLQGLSILIIKTDCHEMIAKLYKKKYITIDQIISRVVYHSDQSDRYSKYMLREYSYILNCLKDKIDTKHYYILSDIYPDIFEKISTDINTFISRDISDVKLAHMLGYNIYNSIPSKEFMQKRINMLIRDGPDIFYNKIASKNKKHNSEINITNTTDSLYNNLEDYSEYDKILVYSYNKKEKYLHVFSMPEILDMHKRKNYRNYYTNQKLSQLYIYKIKSLIDVHNYYELESLPLRKLYDKYLLKNIEYKKIKSYGKIIIDKDIISIFSKLNVVTFTATNATSTTFINSNINIASIISQNTVYGMLGVPSPELQYTSNITRNYDIGAFSNIPDDSDDIMPDLDSGDDYDYDDEHYW